MIKKYHFIESLPLLKWIVYTWHRKKRNPLCNIKIILIIHLLNDASAFLHALKLLGAQNVIIIGKPYSTIKQAVKEIKLLGFEQIFLPNNLSGLDKYIEENLINTFNQKEKVIILEDGGYCSKIIKKNNLCTKNLLGIVEQTTIGITRNKQIIKQMLDDNKEIDYPIINVAETSSKKELESIEVGNAILRNMETLLALMDKTAVGKEILIVGFGSIGSSVASLLKDKAHVSIYDNDALRRIKAKNMGYNVCSLKQGIKRAQIVIGCSGNTWAMENELIKLNNNVSIVCATSERVEYSHEFLDKNSSSQLKRKWGIQFKLKGKIINLLADGFPINFYGASAKDSVPSISVPGESFQVILSLLLWGVLLLTSNHKRKKGIISFPQKDEINIDKKFEEILNGKNISVNL